MESFTGDENNAPLDLQKLLEEYHYCSVRASVVAFSDIMSRAFHACIDNEVWLSSWDVIQLTLLSCCSQPAPRKR